MTTGIGSVRREDKARALAGIKGYVTNLRACPDRTPVTAEDIATTPPKVRLTAPPGTSPTLHPPWDQYVNPAPATAAHPRSAKPTGRCRWEMSGQSAVPFGVDAVGFGHPRGTLAA